MPSSQDTSKYVTVDGYLIILSTTSDPSTPVVGQIWYRSDL
jgi:hypothetical protein